MAEILKNECEILCDDRNIIKQKDQLFHLYGTWSHGDVKEISSNSAELKAIFFLEKSEHNQIDPIHSKKVIFNKLLACLIRPVTTHEWWQNSLSVLSELSEKVPCWNLQFTKNNQIINLIRHAGVKQEKPYGK